MLSRWWGGAGTRRTPVGLLLVTVIYYVFAIALWLQPERWASTPSYAILIAIMDQAGWGGVYFTVATLLAFTIWKPTVRALAVVAHTAAIAVTALWLVAFIIRFITDDGTTVVNVASWLTYLTLLVQSAFVLDDAYGDKSIGPATTDEALHNPPDKPDGSR